MRAPPVRAGGSGVIALRGDGNAPREGQAFGPAVTHVGTTPMGWKAIDAHRGIVKGAHSDVAENHDTYLYGNPSK
jgi:hypothetical protein